MKSKKTLAILKYIRYSMNIGILKRYRILYYLRNKEEAYAVWILR